MADEISPVSSVSSSSSSSSTQSTNTNNNTQSTSESSSSSSTSSTSESSSSSSSTSSSEKSHEINTSDSTSISNEASEAEESEDGSNLNLDWMHESSESKGKEVDKSKNDYYEHIKDKKQEEVNDKLKEIAVDYEKSFIGQQTNLIDDKDLAKLDRYGTDNNCANFQSSVLDATGQIEKQPYDAARGCSKDDKCYDLRTHLEESGYTAVSKEDAKEGDVWIRIDETKKNKPGHTEMVSGRDENGNLTFVGSNNLKDNPDTTQKEDEIQKVSERLKSDSLIDQGTIYHKDFSEDELSDIAKKIEDGSLVDYAKEKLNDDSLSAEQRENLEELLSDISDFQSKYGDLERLSNGEYTKGEEIWASYYNKVAH